MIEYRFCCMRPGMSTRLGAGCVIPYGMCVPAAVRPVAVLPVYFPCVAESHRRRSGPTTRRSARNTLRVSFTASPRRCGGGHRSARPTVDVEISRYSDSTASDGDARRKCEDSCGDGRASIVSTHSQQRRDRRTHLTTTVSRAVYTM